MKEDLEAYQTYTPALNVEKSTQRRYLIVCVGAWTKNFNAFAFFFSSWLPSYVGRVAFRFCFSRLKFLLIMEAFCVSTCVSSERERERARGKEVGGMIVAGWTGMWVAYLWWMEICLQKL